MKSREYRGCLIRPVPYAEGRYFYRVHGKGFDPSERFYSVRAARRAIDARTFRPVLPAYGSVKQAREDLSAHGWQGAPVSVLLVFDDGPHALTFSPSGETHGPRLVQRIRGGAR